MSVLHDIHRAHIERRKRLVGPLPRSRRRYPLVVAPPPEPPKPLPSQMLRSLIRRAEEIASDLVPETQGVRLADVVNEVATFYGISKLDVLSQRRTESVVRARHVAMYLGRHVTAMSFPQIGRLLGKKDHTTVMHAVNRMEALRQIDDRLNDEIDLIIMRLGEKHLVPRYAVEAVWERRRTSDEPPTEF